MKYLLLFFNHIQSQLYSADPSIFEIRYTLMLIKRTRAAIFIQAGYFIFEDY